MYNEKMEDLLNLSLVSTGKERANSAVLQTGFDDGTKRWEVIIKYNGKLSDLKNKFPDVEGVDLLYQYAILRIPQEQIEAVANDVQVSYMEKPKRLFFA